MYELLNQVIKNKEISELSVIDDQVCDLYESDECLEDEELDECFFVKICINDNEYISTQSYTLDEFEETSFNKIFEDQNIPFDLEELSGMLYEIEDNFIIYNYSECF